MSEFVECQNCGRRFFAENMECPYCKGGGEGEADAVEAAIDVLQGQREGGMFRTLFRAFNLVLFGIALVSLWAIGRPHPMSVRVVLGLECVIAVALFFGSLQRRSWVRPGAIVFILANAVLGLLAVVRQGRPESLAWGPGPLVLVVFLIPFFSKQARARYWR